MCQVYISSGILVVSELYLTNKVKASPIYNRPFALANCSN